MPEWEFAIDEKAFDILASLFMRCRDLDIEVPDEMPLDTPVQQRIAVHYVAKLITNRITGRQQP